MDKEKQMKRSKNMNIARMRKGRACSIITTIALAGAAIGVVGCSCEEEEEKTKVKVVSSVEACVAKSDMTEQQCKDAYDKAVKNAENSAPKYENKRSCVEEFGPSQCRQSESGVWMPLMTGFMIGNMLGNSGTNHYHHYSPVYTNSSGSYVNSSGSSIGKPGKTSYTVASSTAKPQPKSTISSTKSTYGKPTATKTTTTSKGIFGSKSSAKSSWGSSTKSGSWGG